MSGAVGAAGPDAWSAVPGGWGSLGAIVLVLGLVCVLAWLARRGTLRLPGGNRRVPIRIEAAAALGDRRSLVVVAVEGRRLLLGLSPASVSLVTELSPESAAFAGTLDAKVAAPDVQS